MSRPSAVADEHAWHVQRQSAGHPGDGRRDGLLRRQRRAGQVREPDDAGRAADLRARRHGVAAGAGGGPGDGRDPRGSGRSRAGGSPSAPSSTRSRRCSSSCRCSICRSPTPPRSTWRRRCSSPCSPPLFLGERVGAARWLAIGVGFLGVVLIIQPRTDGFNGYALVCLLVDRAARRARPRDPARSRRRSVHPGHAVEHDRRHAARGRAVAVRGLAAVQCVRARAARGRGRRSSRPPTT